MDKCVDEAEMAKKQREIRDVMLRCIPEIREISPKEYDEMIKNGTILADKLAIYMQGAARGQGVEPTAIPALIGAAIVKVAPEVIAVVAGVVAGEIAAQRAGGVIVAPSGRDE